jgi:hypothetical protein
MLAGLAAGGCEPAGLVAALAAMRPPELHERMLAAVALGESIIKCQ